MQTAALAAIAPLQQIRGGQDHEAVPIIVIILSEFQFFRIHRINESGKFPVFGFPIAYNWFLSLKQQDKGPHGKDDPMVYGDRPRHPQNLPALRPREPFPKLGGVGAEMPELRSGFRGKPRRHLGLYVRQHRLPHRHLHHRHVPRKTREPLVGNHHRGGFQLGGHAGDLSAKKRHRRRIGFFAALKGKVLLLRGK